MAERDEFNKQYGYNAMSNKVEQVDRRGNNRQQHHHHQSSQRNEPTGEVITLSNRTDIGRMGDRVITGKKGTNTTGSSTTKEDGEDHNNTTKKKKKSSYDNDDSHLKMVAKKQKKSKFDPSGFGGSTSTSNYYYGTDNNSHNDMNQNEYIPTNENSRSAYEQILAILVSSNNNRDFIISNQGPSVLKEVANEIIATLKDALETDSGTTTTTTVQMKQNMISKLLTGKNSASSTGLSKSSKSSSSGGFSNELFTKFVQLVKQIDDYNTNTTSNNNDNEYATTNTDQMDDEMGVAVVFDDENDDNNNNDDDDDDNIDRNAVIDPSSSSSSDEDEEENDDDADNRHHIKSRTKQQALESDEDDNNEGNNNDTEDEDDENILKPNQVLAPKNVDSGDGSTTTTTATKVSSSKRNKLDRIVTIHEIDAHYVQRQLAYYYPNDPELCATKATNVLKILDIRTSSSSSITNTTTTTTTTTNNDIRECENKLLIELGFDLYNVIKLLQKNRIKIWAVVSRKRATSQKERDDIDFALLHETTGEGKRIYDEIHNHHSQGNSSSMNTVGGIGTTTMNNNKDDVVSKAIDSIGIQNKNNQGDDTTMLTDQNDLNKKDDDVPVVLTELDLELLAFQDGALSNMGKQCVLPPSSYRLTKKGYEEVHVPAVRNVVPVKGEKELINIKTDLPIWTHSAFKGMDTLNRIQSQLCDVALKSSENILLCAPTGAGKTNVACLTMLNILGQYRREKNNIKKEEDDDDDESNDDDDENLNDNEKKSTFDLQAFKIVYVAPMKALVQEVVKNFSERLADYNVTVRELSGDSSLTRQQISETQVLVTTPEKWDIITRQGDGRAYTQLVRLIIIDEIHLLHDERGPVLESIVARSIRQVETTAEPIRLVGLSATLPNYRDVATFLRVNPEKGLFFFDHSYRPVPLQMQYIGISERNALKRFNLQNEICYEKAMDQRRNSNQLLIFVHSRAETAKTAKALRDIALERDELSPYFVKEGSATHEILREECASVKNSDLKDVLPHGFAIHHAGMVREDRELVEDLFADRHISVLCCTATLAWGVNLPAHAVIIRGTQIYDPAKGKWAELSPLDIMQMLGRAGRPQYDSEGEGIIITQHSQLQYYLSLTNVQLPVESQLIKSLPNHLNAEVVLGSVQSIAEAVDWLGYTFLYVRMLQNPTLYGLSEESIRDDPTLKRRRLDLAHTAASMLEKSNLLRYDRKSGALQATPLGRIASQFYISHTSMAVYTRNMRANMSDIELLRLFAMSGEFTHITVREEEKLELVKLAGRVPIPVKESPSEPSAKVNILLQAYISRLRLDGFALVADMAFIQQSAARIMRALFEIALKRNWSSLAKLCLDMSNMVSYRIWRSQCPLRQYKNVPDIVCRKLERKSDIEWARYVDLTISDLGELVGVPKMGRVLHKLVHQFPRFELSAQIQPITRSMLRVELTLVPAFQYDITVHSYSQLFHVIVEDVNGEMVLHHETFYVKSRDSEEEIVLMFTVAILEPLPPAYFIRVLSDRWLHSVAALPISFNAMILPAKFPPCTELLDLQPLLTSALGEPTLAKIYPFKEFNPIQTQTFHELFKTGKNCLICSPSNSGKTVCATFAILRMLTTDSNGKCVYVTPSDDIADPTYDQLMKHFGALLPRGTVVRLTGETAPDLDLLKNGKVIVASVKQWDILSRRWKQRKVIQTVTLMIFDELHFLGGELGPSLETVISRTRFMSNQLQKGGDSGGGGSIRIVGLSASLANARDVGDWMGVSNKSLFNFSPKARSFPLEIYFQSFEQSNYSARLMAMAKPVYNAVSRHSDGDSVIVFVPSKRQAQLTAIDFMTFAESQDSTTYLGKGVSESEIIEASSGLRESALQQVIRAGIGYVHSGMIGTDFATVIDLYQSKKIRVLVCPADLCWKLRCVSHLVVIMGTESYDGREGRHVDYPIVDLLHMMGRHGTGSSGKCVILCHSPKKDYLKKLLYDPLPVESHLDSYLHDPLNSEIVTKTVSSMQDAIDYLTWTFLYRRLSKNPTYYGLRGTTNVFLSEYLSEMIESVVGDLEESKCCKIEDEGEISPLNLGMIAAYYYIQYRTVELIASSISAKTKIRGILEILSASWEFSVLPLRYSEDKEMKMMTRHLVHKLPENASYDSNTKALILLQNHFSRITPPPDMREDQKFVVKESVHLLQAIVDVISSSGWLKPAIAAMELSQMVVQGLWNKDNVLKQIPHFTDEIIQRCQNYKGDEPIEGVLDILSLDDDIRNQLLQLSDERMSDVAVFCNSYPNVDVTFTVQDVDDIEAGDSVVVIVNLEREIDEEEMAEEEMTQIGTVAAPLFPCEKKEGWWVVIGDTSKNSLLSLKRINLQHKQKVTLEFNAPEDPGDYDLTLFCMSDSYLGCDQEYSIPLSVAAASAESDEEGEESSADEE